MMPFSDQLPDQALLLDHARIGQEFLQIDPQAARIGGVGCTEIDEQNADALARRTRRGPTLTNRNNDRHTVWIRAPARSCQARASADIVAKLTAKGFAMTVAEWCIFGAVILYLLTIVPFKALGSPGFDNGRPRDLGFYDDPLRARALGRTSTASKPFHFSR